MRRVFIYIAIITYVVSNAESKRRSAKSLPYATMSQLVRSAGYPIEKYYVHTPDDYILQLYRIPNGKEETKKISGKKQAVLLVHGLHGGCDNFVIMGPNKSIAYLLADAGYDVWLANMRGNLFTSHKYLTRKDSKFWDYSFDEHGKYDVTGVIDRILNETGLSRVLYVGHSMGFTVLVSMLSYYPEYNDKLVAFVGFGAASYLGHLKNTVDFLINTLNLPKLLSDRGIKALAMPHKSLEAICDYCTASPSNTEVCLSFIYSIVGEDYEQYVPEMGRTFIMRMQPASTQQSFHYAKIALTGVLTAWEGGLDGPVRPYNLSHIRIPVALWYGGHDRLTEKSQMLRLARELNETGVLYFVGPVAGWHKFNHLDFIFAKDIDKLLNKPVVEQIKELFEKYDKPSVE